jgi:hypothetical protein
VVLEPRLVKQVLKVKANATSNECLAMTQNILYSAADIGVGEFHNGLPDSK